MIQQSLNLLLVAKNLLHATFFQKFILHILKFPLRILCSRTGHFTSHHHCNVKYAYETFNSGQCRPM